MEFYHTHRCSCTILEKLKWNECFSSHFSFSILCLFMFAKFQTIDRTFPTNGKSKFTGLRRTHLEKHCNVPFTKSNCSSFAIQNNSHTRKPIHHMSRHVMDECTTTIRCANGCALTWNASLAVSLTALHRAACGTPGVRQASRLDTARSWLQTYG